ncbi:hypothetical protein Bbelb_293970 [Branchiostoma belcheri]|nr:hypothetical protein Bbelb_293970 [Branchiostoma belcheri]
MTENGANQKKLALFPADLCLESRALFLQILGLAYFLFLSQMASSDWFRTVLKKATDIERETSGLFLNAWAKNLSSREKQFWDRISETEEDRYGNISVKLPSDILENLVPPFGKQKFQLSDIPYTRDQHHVESVCPVSLRWRVKSSDWFKFRFVEDVKLFMDREDLDDSYWNDHLGANFELPFGYKPDRKGDGRMVTQQLIGMLENPDVFGFHGDRQRKPCVRCAVVGTGGVLRGSNKGEEIDAHDYVFRVNHAVMDKPFDKDVGKKLSFYIFYPESHSRQNKLVASAHALQIYIPFKTTDLPYITQWLYNRTLPKCGVPWCESPLNANVNRTTTKVVHPDFIRYVFVNYMDTSLSLRPTTGAMTVFLAIQLCDVVNIYGFGYDPRFNEHYYDHQKVAAQGADGDMKADYHDFSEERRLWQRLQEEKIITWHNRQDSPNSAVP